MKNILAPSILSADFGILGQQLQEIGEAGAEYVHIDVMAGQVIILNPIPERKWKYMQSAKTFSSVCNMISCATLRDLAAACRKLMRQ